MLQPIIALRIVPHEAHDLCLWLFAERHCQRNHGAVLFDIPIKAQIIRTGMTMQEVVDQLSEEYGWSDSVSNLSAKLQRESIRYKEVLELADVLGYDIVWQKRRDE